MRDSTMSRKKHDTTPVAAAAELAHGLLGEDDAKPVSETRADWIEVLADTRAPDSSTRAREGECELGTLAIGKRCQERISATGWAWLGTVRGIRSRHALCGAQMVRGSPAA